MPARRRPSRRVEDIVTDDDIIVERNRVSGRVYGFFLLSILAYGAAACAFLLWVDTSEKYGSRGPAAAGIEIFFDRFTPVFSLGAAVLLFAASSDETLVIETLKLTALSAAAFSFASSVGSGGTGTTASLAGGAVACVSIFSVSRFAPPDAPRRADKSCGAARAALFLNSIVLGVSLVTRLVVLPGAFTAGSPGECDASCLLGACSAFLLCALNITALFTINVDAIRAVLFADLTVMVTVASTVALVAPLSENATKVVMVSSSALSALTGYVCAQRPFSAPLIKLWRAVKSVLASPASEGYSEE